MTAKLRTANIQGFKILQWRSLPPPFAVRLSHGLGLYHKSKAVRAERHRNRNGSGQMPQNMAIPPLT
jgi:hypothetical protein